jgi:hypothetical protein
MASEVKSAEQATKIAASFLTKYYFFLHPISAVKENATWIVRVDVGAIGTQIAEVKIDTLTGDITAYSVPE